MNKLRQVYEIRKAAGRSTKDLDSAGPEGIGSILRFHAWDEAMNVQSTTVAMTSENLLYDLYMGDYTQVTLTFAAGDAPQTDGTLYVYVVNPHSRNMDAAVKFIGCVARLESEPYIYYAIHPECKLPYEQPGFGQLIAGFVQDKRELAEILENAQDADRAELKDIQAMLDFYDQYPKNQEKEQWMISAETIEKHHKLLESLRLHASSLYLGAPGSTAEQLIGELCVRYAEGNMTQDAFLDALSSKMRMVQLKSK